MATANPESLDKSQVLLLWSDAVIALGKDPAAKALGARGNFRVNGTEALKAAYHTVKLLMEGKAAVATGDFSPMTIAKLLKGGYDALSATFRSFYETLSEAGYVVSIVMSRFDGGLTKEELLERSLDFVRGNGYDELPFYLGLSDAFVANARSTLEFPGGLDGILKELSDLSLIEHKREKLFFKPKNFEWGLR